MKIKLTVRNKLVVWIIFLLSTCCTANSHNVELEKLFADINALLADDAISVKRLPPNLKNKLDRSNIKNFPTNRDELELAVRLALPHYDNDINRFRRIAEKYYEIESLALNEKSIASSNLQKRLFEKYAFVIQLQKSRLELILNKSITTRNSLASESEMIDEKIANITMEISELEAEATKNRL